VLCGQQNNFRKALEMYETAYYVWVTNDDANEFGERWWDVEGVYSNLSDAESHKLSLLLSKEYMEVVIVPGPLRVS
jgi:hypothetical protein